MISLPFSTPTASLAPAARVPLFQALTALALALSLLCLLWMPFEARQIAGVPVFLKPMKFAISFAALFGTLALVETRLTVRTRQGWAWRLTGLVMAAAFLAEMAWLIWQAARGEASHFNLSTPFHAFMYRSVMGGGALALVFGIGIIGWIARRDEGARLGPGLREGIWLGFLASSILTLVIAGKLSTGTGPFTGIHPPGAPVLPFFGWSGVTGDLRPAHFLSLHAMQVLPLVGLWRDRTSPARARGFTRLAALVYAVLTLAVFAQALAGWPLIVL
ncbi:MAG: hypothetical protein O9322_01955 [Beijerinckiaceae bacterium]|nr:hypothetical protein [Beijerinckiaceae bacterium]MCZ8301655.1 hypothetical protein [Beijerinckiaceae bacterium]